MNEEEQKIRFNGNNKDLHPLERKYGIENSVSKENYEKGKWDWH